jgi:hypothetical protein
MKKGPFMNQTQVSVIIPTCNRYPVLLQNIENLRKQKTPIQIIVCDDTHINDLKNNREILAKIQSVSDKYFYTALYDHEGNKLYGLGHARNKGVIEADYDILVFLDDRITPDSVNMIDVFVNKLKDLKSKNWVFGDKGAHKTSFVENCSATWRLDLINAGMFCEAVCAYGFMTRELFTRLSRQGWKFQYIPEALAKPLCTGTRRESTSRDKQIEYSRSMLKKMKIV